MPPTARWSLPTDAAKFRPKGRRQQRSGWLRRNNKTSSCISYSTVCHSGSHESIQNNGRANQAMEIRRLTIWVFSIAFFMLLHFSFTNSKKTQHTGTLQNRPYSYFWASMLHKSLLINNWWCDRAGQFRAIQYTPHLPQTFPSRLFRKQEPLNRKKYHFKCSLYRKFMPIFQNNNLMRYNPTLYSNPNPFSLQII